MRAKAVCVILSFKIAVLISKKFQVVDLIKKAGNEIKFLVIDERSDDVKAKNKPYLFRIVQGKSGYGFYIWHDDEGHYVEVFSTITLIEI